MVLFMQGEVYESIVECAISELSRNGVLNDAGHGLNDIIVLALRDAQIYAKYQNKRSYLCSLF